MSHISCNVIRDLLPSYMDKIASDDSVKLVEEHLAQCSECRNFKDRMGKPDLYLSEKDGNLDYMKKIRKLTTLKSSICFFLVLITGVIFSRYTKDLQQPGPFFLLAAIMLLCNYILFFQKSQKEAAGKGKTILFNVVSILLILYIMFMIQLSFYNLMNGKGNPFDIEDAKLGPFLYHQLILIMIAEIIIWLREIVLYIRKSRFSIISSSFGIIGFYMSLYYARMLRRLDTLDVFRMINHNALLLFAEGIGILLLLFIIEKIKNKMKS